MRVLMEVSEGLIEALVLVVSDESFIGETKAHKYGVSCVQFSFNGRNVIFAKLLTSLPPIGMQGLVNSSLCWTTFILNLCRKPFLRWLERREGLEGRSRLGVFRRPRLGASVGMKQFSY